MARNSESDKRRAAYMKERGIVRTTMRCCNCYGIVACEGPKSKHTHKCPTGGGRNGR